MGNIGLHHFHRTKLGKKVELSSFSHKLRGFVDRWIYFIAIVGPLLSFTQLFKILSEKTANGVSLFTWSTLLVLSIFWLFYGFVHNDKPIIISNTLWVILQISVVISVIVYG